MLVLSNNHIISSGEHPKKSAIEKVHYIQNGGFIEHLKGFLNWDWYKSIIERGPLFKGSITEVGL